MDIFNEDHPLWDRVEAMRLAAMERMNLKSSTLAVDLMGVGSAYDLANDLERRPSVISASVMEDLQGIITVIEVIHRKKGETGGVQAHDLARYTAAWLGLPDPQHPDPEFIQY